MADGMSMKAYDRTKMFTELCQLNKKWGIYIRFDWNEDLEEVIKAAPYLDYKEHGQILMDGIGVFLGTKEEMMDLYKRTVGDDGPTELNPYNGPATVYAQVCNSEGSLLYENT